MNKPVDGPSYFMICSPAIVIIPGRNAMKWMLLAASTVIAAGLSLPSHAAQPATPSETQAAALPVATDDPITFEQYREWRLRFIERRQTQLTAQLAAADLQPRQRARLEQA